VSAEKEFKPKLGKIRSLGSKRARRYVQQVLRAVALAGGVRGRSSSSRFYGNRIGRGAGVGRVLAMRDGYAAFRVRRVIIKSRIVKMRGKGVKAARLHVRYIQRDGVTRDGAPGELYDAREEGVEGKAFIERSEGDRHQFRFIVSAEDGAEYEDLKPFARRLMNRMEEDLGTKLDWVAVDHYNTAHPHTHVILRGQDDRGKDLIIARDYLTQGMRERAAEIVTLDFGPRSDFDIESRLRLEIDQERYTSLDRRLVKDLDKNGLISAHAGGLSGFQQTLRAGRLHKLRRLGLADETSPSVWHVATNLEETLKSMGTRGDIINTMHRDFAERGLARPRMVAATVLTSTSARTRLPAQNLPNPMSGG
jgi:type IV secretory pathway VirD2 relaxase